MFARQFGDYLVSKELISQDTLESIITKMDNSRAKLGVLAVSEGILTGPQVADIHKLQTQRDARFGTIAVDEGFMTEEQLSHLLNMQGNPYAKFISLLCEDTSMTVSDIDEALNSFKNENGFNDEELEGLKNDDFDVIIPIFAFSSKSYVTDICALALKNIVRFVTSDFSVGKIKRVNEIDYRCLVGQKLIGHMDVSIGFYADTDDEGIILLGNGFSGEEATTLGLNTYDAVGEFTNCISGLFATAISKKGVLLEILPQLSYENQCARGEAYVLPIYIKGHVVHLFINVDNYASLGDMPVVKKIQTRAGGEVTIDSKATVVIVDDSGMSRKILRNILEEDGYAVVAEGSDGLEGVLAYKEHDPDIITLDITMPNMDGTEALREIKAYDENAKVIMITAAGQQNKIIEALKLGADRFVTKPFDKDEILKNINEMLNN